MERPLRVLLILTVALVGGCDWNHQAKQRKIQSENDRRWEGEVIALANKYNAVSDWEAKLPMRGFEAAPFSIEVSSTLIQSNGQPILLLMELQDVYEKSGKYVAVFRKADFRKHGFQLRVDLKCSEQQINQCLGIGARGAYQPWAVVARFEEVSRPRFEVLGTVEGGDEDGPITGVELDYSPAVFHAKGECVDLLRKGEIK